MRAERACLAAHEGRFDVGTVNILEETSLGLYVAKAIPDDTYALITDEKPQDYWYVLPITIALAAILLVFVRASIKASAFGPDR